MLLLGRSRIIAGEGAVATERDTGMKLWRHP